MTIGGTSSVTTQAENAAGSPAKAQEADEQEHTPDQGEDHRRQLGGLDQSFGQAPLHLRDLALAYGAVDIEQKDDHGAECACLRRCRGPGVDRTEDDRDNEEDRKRARDALKALAPGKAC